MPYIMVDELPEGTEEAYVVDKNEYDSAVSDRDALLERAVKAEDAYSALQKKYASAFLSTRPPGRGLPRSRHGRAFHFRPLQVRRMLYA